VLLRTSFLPRFSLRLLAHLSSSSENFSLLRNILPTEDELHAEAMRAARVKTRRDEAGPRVFGRMGNRPPSIGSRGDGGGGEGGEAMSWEGRWREGPKRHTVQAVLHREGQGVQVRNRPGGASRRESVFANNPSDDKEKNHGERITLHPRQNGCGRGWCWLPYEESSSGKNRAPQPRYALGKRVWPA